MNVTLILMQGTGDMGSARFVVSSTKIGRNLCDFLHLTTIREMELIHFFE